MINLLTTEVPFVQVINLRLMRAVSDGDLNKIQMISHFSRIYFTTHVF